MGASRSRGLEEGARNTVYYVCERELDWFITREEGNSCCHVVLVELEQRLVLDANVGRILLSVVSFKFFYQQVRARHFATASREVA